MSSPEVERFEVTEEDLQNEFNPNRPQFRQTKHRATYGIWADEDSDDERPSFGKKSSRRDFSTPVSFVSGGVKVGDKVTKEEGDGEDDDSDSDDMQVERSMFASRFGSQKPTRGSAYVPKVKQQPGQDGIGDWERHTRGIGAKLLGKYGHVPGKGLGKSQQGISTPVEAFKRKGKGALGFYGTERTDRSLADFPVQKDEDQVEAENFKAQMQQWKKGGEGEKKRLKYVYKTADEIIAIGGKGKKKKPDIDELPKVKVIDMTGKEQRVLSGYQALSQKHDRPEEEEPYAPSQERKHFDLPELIHNLDLLVDLAEEDIIENDRKMKYEKDMEVNLTYEHEKNKAICEQEEKHISRLKEILEIINKCEEYLKPGKSTQDLNLEDCASMFRKIQDEYYEEYQLYELSSLAFAVLLPLMKTEFEGWEPLKTPRHGIVTVLKWRDLLGVMDQPYKQSNDDGSLDPFDRIMWDIWTPRIRLAVSQWNVRDPDGMTEVIEAWKPILPQWIFHSVLEQLIFPRLQDEVDAWNPLTDTIPIHAWLHPWLPLMGSRLEPLYAPIRHKLANALTNWHPSDASAKMILQPWVSVFSQAHMDAFLIKHILPKLNMCMMEFVINPQQQILDPWHWVMSWIDLMPVTSLVGLLDATFFPQWMRVLCSWLSANPNYDEVTKWYTGWKSMFPEKLLCEPAISEQFNKALEVMNRAVSGHFHPGPRENIPFLPPMDGRRPFEPEMDRREPSLGVPRGIATAPRTTLPTSFREMVERKAEENNLEFLPVPNRTYEAKQVYRFGRVFIYMDRNVIFLNENGQWMPVSLNTLVDRGR